MASNPYTLLFGREPKQMIPRTGQSGEIIEEFLDSDPSEQVYVITGIRGSGKTVMLTHITKQFKQQKNWIVVELNPAVDLLQELFAQLQADQRLTQIFRDARIDLQIPRKNIFLKFLW